MPKHILIVDDNDEVRQIIALDLEDRGYRVTMAKTGAAMREHLRGEPPIDAAVLDWIIPGERCRDLALHAKERGCPVIIICGNLDPTEFAAANRFPMLVKPFKSDALVEAIEREINR